MDTPFPTHVDRLVSQWLTGVQVANEDSVREASRQTGLSQPDIHSAQWTFDQGGVAALRRQAESEIQRQDTAAPRVCCCRPNCGHAA